MKSLVKILPLLLLLGLTTVFLEGCGDHHHYHDGYDYTITVVNDTPWDIFVEPWGFLLAPGDRVDVDIGPDIVHVIAVRHFDGLVLADVDMAYGDVLVVE
jgi:hypothetical protein